VLAPGSGQDAEGAPEVDAAGGADDGDEDA
jgi:hypothetical protein